MTTIDEPFASGDSLIHRIDPRVRVASAVVLSLPAALVHELSTSLVALAMGLVLIQLARLPFGKVLARLAVINIFILFLWLFLPFSVPGETIWAAGPLQLSRQGVNMALLITVKCNGLGLMLMALLGTVAMHDFGPALQRLKVPEKFCHLLLFTYRYIHVIHREYLTMRRGMEARGFRPRTDARTYRAYAWLVGMLLVKSWDRAERVLTAMQARGFQGRFYSLRRFHARTGDQVFFLVVVLLAATLIWLDISCGA